MGKRHPNRKKGMNMSLSVPSDIGAYSERRVTTAETRRRASKFDGARERCKTPRGRQLVGSLEILEDRLARIKTSRRVHGGKTPRFSEKEKEAMQALHQLCSKMEQKQHATAQRILTHRW